MRLRGAVKPTAFALPFAARTCHAWLARLTRARGRRFLRGWKILLNDFWYFWSHKSTIKEKYLYVKDNTSSTAIAVPLLPLEKANSYFRQRRYQTHARHALSAGVQTMRARICSVSSCDMFARVVWLRLRRARDSRLSLCHLPHALATHGSRD